jgi:hypothetical protein
VNLVPKDDGGMNIHYLTGLLCAILGRDEWAEHWRREQPFGYTRPVIDLVTRDGGKRFRLRVEEVGEDEG